MKNKIRMLIIYFLMLLVFALVGYLIYFVMTYESPSESKVEKDTYSEEKFEVTSECTYEITMSDFNNFANGKSTLDLCDEYNKFNVSGVNLENKKLNIELIYYNGATSGIDDEGVFINKERVINNLAKDHLLNLGVFDNVLYIKTFTDSTVDVMAYNSYGTEVYRLSKSLSETPITDAVFKDLSLENTSLNNTNIDSNSFVFGTGGFSFNSDIKKECLDGQLYKGSTYKVNYIDGTFSNPTFVNNVGC